MWKAIIKQEYEYSYLDGTASTGTHESTYQFAKYVDAMNFIEWAIKRGIRKTTAYIEFVEGEENERKDPERG